MARLAPAIVSPFRLEVKEGSRGAGAVGLTVSEIPGFGRPGGTTEGFQENETRLEFVATAWVGGAGRLERRVDAVLEPVATRAARGRIGDGTIWSTPVDPDAYPRPCAWRRVAVEQEQVSFARSGRERRRRSLRLP